MKRFFTGLFGVITFVAALTYLISCFTPYINPVAFWPMAFLALGFPYLFVGILFLAFVWVFIKRKAALCLLLLLFVGFDNLRSTVAVNFLPSHRPSVKDSGSLRILAWNVRSFDNPAIHADSPTSERRKIFNYIENSGAEILCLQEFSEFNGAPFLSNTKQLIDLGYIYHYKTNEIVKHFSWGTIETGSAIFSKLPLLDSGKTLLGDPSYPEHLAYADVHLSNKPLRIYTTHFKSLNLFANVHNSREVYFYGNTYYIYDASIFEKLKVFAQEHTREAFIVKEQLNKSPYPVFYAADMNSVPTSYPYHIVSKGLTDVFISTGCGLGTTMANLPKTLRIDYIFLDKKLSLKNFEKEEVYLSDHFPHMIDVSWKQ